jgi:hypothetical protein
MAKDKKDLSLEGVKTALAVKGKEFLKGLQEEIVEEEQMALKDFIKGAYRLSLEKEREMEALQKEVAQIKEAIQKAGEGEWKDLSAIKIPARFFEESTLRRHGKSLISGSQEIRFMDLYVQEDNA